MTTEDLAIIALESLHAGLFKASNPSPVQRLTYWRSVMAAHGVELPAFYSFALIELERVAGLRKPVAA